MIIVTNNTKVDITRAGRTFAPGENHVPNAELSPAKLAQISHHPDLKWVQVEDRPIDSDPAVTKASKKGDK